MGSKRTENRERDLVEYLQSYGIHAQWSDQMHAGGSGDPGISAQAWGNDCQVEVERIDSVDIYKAMEKAVNDCDGSYVPMVMHSRNRGEWYVTMRLSDLLENEVRR